MKNLNFLSGFLLAICLFFMISASTNSQQTEQIPRYHITHTGYNQKAYVYDAVTGELEIVNFDRINDNSTLKALLKK